MQDFTKQPEVNRKPLNQAKNDKWLSKDRLWNFVFWFGMSGGFSLAFAASDINKMPGEFSYWSTFISWLTILGVPLLVRYFSKTTFVKDTIFLNSDGGELDVRKQLPNSFVVIVSTIALTTLFGIIVDSKLLYISEAIGFFILITIIFGIPTLFFIFKNCPISILFNCKFWALELSRCQISASGSRYRNFSSSSRPSSTDYITNPTYGGLSSNIYNKYR